MNCCRSEKPDGKLLRGIFALEEGMVPDRNARGWRVEGENRRVSRKERRRGASEVGGFMAQEGLWNIA